MFCPNCGTRCADEARFCGNCGTKLPEMAPKAATVVEKPQPTPAPAPTPTPVSTPAPASAPAPAAAPATRPTPSVVGRSERMPLTEGVILTNSAALARKLNTEAKVVRELLEAYARASLQRQIRYHLLDVADYTMLNPDARGRRISLSPREGWEPHVSLLADLYRFGRNTTQEQSCYLFIVGGEDVIPMPVMRHYMASHPRFNDKDIDTDLPYAYLLNEKSYPLLLSGKLFEYEQYFHVGRLPFPQDASLDDLVGYLRRASASGGEVALERYFGQTNMPWGDESQVVCTPLRRAGLRSVSERYEGATVEAGGNTFDIVQGGLFYSPPVTEDNVDQVFDPHADFYYFNLHGSDKPTHHGYYADYVGGAVMPEHVALMESPNLFVTEACYGAKFQEYDRRESILLSAITTQTLLFLGSSRIAFCNNRYSIDNSDRLANVYINELLKGRTGGEALYLARKSFFEYDNGRLYDQQMVTIAEFNLFGDPTLRVAGCEGGSMSGRCVMAETPVKRVTESKCLYEGKGETASAPRSILEQVRGAVDSNLRAIREVVDRELYERLGVEPRSLQAIYQNRFSDGKSFYSFDYQTQEEDQERTYFAIADERGKVQTVISTK